LRSVNTAYDINGFAVRILEINTATTIDLIEECRSVYLMKFIKHLLWLETI